jgi:predicted acylesterase/phospholipase RssA
MEISSMESCVDRPQSRRAWQHAIVALIVALATSACGTLPRNPVPIDAIYSAEVPGFPGVRAWAGEVSADFQADLVQSMRDERQAAFPVDENRLLVRNGLSLSGGGSNGAFGAGFLVGWTESGTRPDFKLVTGISTGALIAPFAFLGAPYDAALTAVYTSISTDDILKRRSVFKILGKSDSLATSGPLRYLVESYITSDMLRAIANKHDAGHRLYIGTTNIDAQRLVIWNMGQIAKHGSPEALRLFHDVLVASSSIPVLFPPVFFNVEVDRQAFDEMHADGGTMVQAFFYAGTVDLVAARNEAHGPGFRPGGGLYIIRNGSFNVEAEQVERDTMAIMIRAFDTMIKTAAVGDLYRMYAFAQRDGVSFNFVDLPDSYVSQSEEMFDQAEMTRLFEIGKRLARSEKPWANMLPGFLSMSLDPEIRDEP